MIMNPEVKERFIKHSQAIAALREYLASLNFIEMDTPILDTKYAGREAKPFTTFVNGLASEVYIIISPEMYLKRLIVGGIKRVFTISRSFKIFSLYIKGYRVFFKKKQCPPFFCYN